MKSKIAMLGLSFLLTGCTNSNDTPNKTETMNKQSEISQGDYKKITNFVAISPQSFQELYNTKETIVIDIRTAPEIAEGKIFSEALEIDFYKENFLEEIAKLDKNKKYLLYCHSGNRSGQALKIFRQLGFAEVYDLDGGISNWSKALEK
jgi:rhodanese-related sulfurtransferase